MAEGPGKPLFELGRVVATPGALTAIEKSRQTPDEFLARHVSGDGGSVPPEDKVENEVSIMNGYRIQSSYVTRLDVRIWVVTEANRELTTILLPEEY